MKLLCDVCENAVASVVCCADEAALCSSCDARVHAANKLASKHLRVPLLSEEAPEPAMCDICQEKPSFFFCVEDRALLCRECDLSIHSANALAAKHKRLLLTGIKVGVHTAGGTSQETSSGVTLEQHVSATASPAENIVVASKKLCSQSAPATATGMGSKDDGVLSTAVNLSKPPSSPQRATQRAGASSYAKMLRSYTMTKGGTLHMAPSSNDVTQQTKAEPADTKIHNTTTISIQRISAGQGAPFVAPVLSSIRAALLHEEGSADDNNHTDSSYSKKKHNSGDYSNKSIMMDLDCSSPVDVAHDSDLDYLNSGIPGWRLDELLTDLAGVCDGGRPLSPPKETIVPGFGIHDEQQWFAELDFLEEHEISPSREEEVALVPEMPSPPTNSGLVTSRGKGTCASTQPWAFDYLFTGPDHLHEFSVVPDIGGRTLSPSSPASPTRDNVSKKRRFWNV